MVSRSNEKYPVCPRCKGFIPNNERPGAYPGALSRADNKTEVCSACGLEEAVNDVMRGQYRKADGGDMMLWPIESPRAVDPALVDAMEIHDGK